MPNLVAPKDVPRPNPTKAKRHSRFTKYQDNADDILDVQIDVQATDRDEQLCRVAVMACPFLRHPESEHDDDGKSGEEDPVQVLLQSSIPKQQRPNSMINSDDLTVKILNGGLSNELFIVSKNLKMAEADSDSDATSAVLVRIHPDNNNGTGFSVVDREVENRLVAWLSHQGMAPIFYGRFQNGRVEEFYQNVLPLSSQEMPRYAISIAHAMADFHRLEAPASILPKPTTSIASVYERLTHWLQAIPKAPTSTTTSTSSATAAATTNDDQQAFVNRLQSEWHWLQSQLLQPPTRQNNPKALQFIRQVVVTHMDGQSLNVLKESTNATKEDDISIRLIDFEYAGWNPRAADIANTFCEYCDMNNLKADYEAEYPSDQQQDDYLRAYIERADPSLAAQLQVQALKDDDSFLATLRSEVGRFSLLSHLGWSIWSVLKSDEKSGIDFEYMVYARHRMDGYEWAKKKFFAQEE